MHPFDEMKAWVRFGPDDEERLRALWPAVQPQLFALTDTFYERILEQPGAAAVIRDEAQVERLKGTLRRWAEELVRGPWDEAYYDRRERIGRVHVDVGLHSRYMFTAMNVFRQGLCRIASACLPPAEAELAHESLGRVCDMDLGIMTGTYVSTREARQMMTLQDLIVSHLPVTVLLLDSHGVVTAATRPGTRLFGEIPAIGHSWQEALPPALVRAAELGAHIEHALTTHREVTLTRVDVALDGEARNFQISLVPLGHPHTGMLLHLEELTGPIQAETRLQRSESLAQLGTLAAVVSHELRNPLAGISGAIQVLVRSFPEDDPRKRIMEKVDQQVGRLNTLVTELLEFARPTEARLGVVALDALARQVVELVQRDHPDVVIAASGRGNAIADPDLVHRVILNLVLNAVQAMADPYELSSLLAVQEVRIIVTTASVLVNDSGPGVSAENLEVIFEPFFTTRTRGTGLGLAICKKAATAMNGRLSLSTGPLPGAAFLLELQA